MKTLLVTGASGFLGWQVCQLARSHWQVHGTYSQHPLNLPQVTLHSLDLTDQARVQAFLGDLRPDAIIHTAAQAKPNRCEQDPAGSEAINVQATRYLAQYCAAQGIPGVFTSTDLVFDGHSAPYAESAPPSPVNTYGRQKAEAERVFLTCHPAGVVCRMPLMYGPASPVAQSFLQDFLAVLRAGKPLKLFVDEYRTPVHGEDGARGLLLALERGQGILHLGGPERMSRYEFGQRMVEVFGFSPEQILPCRQADVPMAAVRPADVSMESDRAFALGYAPRSVQAGLTAIAQSM